MQKKYNEASPRYF